MTGAPLVTLDRVDVRLGDAAVLSDVSLSLHAGDGLGVLGANGSGKSTLLRLLRGEVWPHPSSPGRRLFHGPDGAFESPIGVRERLALVAPEAQDAYLRRDWELPVEVVIRSGFSDAVWPSEAATPAQAARVRQVAEELGIGHLLGRTVTTLSRGEGRKVLLARALAPDPAALLLDEACDGLDAPSREAFLALVSAIARRGTAVVMATHRPEELVPELGRVIRLEGGRVAGEAGRAPGSLLPGGLAAVLPGGPPAVLPGGPPAAPGAAQAGPGRGAGAPAGPVLFDLRGVTVRVDGRAVLAGVDWTVRAGERWVVAGPNGAGKSTLLRLLLGEEQPAAGTIDRLGLGPRAGADDLRGRVGVVSPELQARHRADASGLEVVLSGFAGSVGLAEPPTAAQRAAASAAIERLGIGHLAARRIHALSYGELRKLLLARALAPGPAALLLDEPLAGLDAASRAFVLGVADQAVAGGTAVVAVTHHLDERSPGAGGVLRLEGGRVAAIERG